MHFARGKATTIWLRRLVGVALALFQVLVASTNPVHADDIHYGYDEDGRLIQVERAGEGAQYRYDTAGNLVEILRPAAGSPAIAGFSPDSGAPGTAVTVLGLGLGATVADNLVQFNGATAVVTEVRPGALVATVPASATTGRLSVTVGGKTAQSASDFQVLGADDIAAPRITGFSPALGAAGTRVTITGKNFGTALGAISLRLNGMPAPIASLTDDEVQFLVPSGVGSGRLQLETAQGVATSADAFYVLPAGVTADQVAVTGRIDVDGPKFDITALPAGKVALILFEARQGQFMGLGISPVTLGGSGSASVAIIAPQLGATLNKTSFSSSVEYDLGQRDFNGDYLIVVTAPSAATLTTALTLSTDVEGALVANGEALTFATSRVGQNGRYSFNANTGDNLSLTWSGTTFVGSSTYVRVYRPDGSEWKYDTFSSTSSASDTLDLSSAPASGTYTVFIDPYNASTGQVIVSLVSEKSGTLTVDGETPIALAAGQNGRYSFNASAGIGHTLAIKGLSFSPSDTGSKTLSVKLYDPDGKTELGSCSFTGNSSCSFYPGSFTKSGAYVFAFDGPGAYATSFTAVLSKDLQGTLTVDAASATTLTTVLPGQSAWLTFNATAGQKLNLAISGVTLGDGDSSTNNTRQFRIYKPSTLASTIYSLDLNSTTNTGSLDLNDLPETGTYVLWVNAYGLDQGSVTVQLNSR